MKRLTLTPLTFAFAVGCGAELSTPPDESASQIIQALTELAERDDAAVDACRAAVDRCNVNLPDAAPEGRCDRLNDHCDMLEGRLAEIREPATACWRGALQCVENAAEQGRCDEALAHCDDFDDGMGVNRRPVVECSERAEACVEKLPELPDGVDPCAKILESCDEAAGGAAVAEGARARRAGILVRGKAGDAPGQAGAAAGDRPPMGGAPERVAPRAGGASPQGGNESDSTDAGFGE